MMPSELISEGFSLMLLGMGFVFLFLSLLVLVTSLMSKIIHRYCPEPLLSVPSTSCPAPVNNPEGLDDPGELVAAISAAIHMHRAKKFQ